MSKMKENKVFISNYSNNKIDKILKLEKQWMLEF